REDIRKFTFHLTNKVTQGPLEEDTDLDQDLIAELVTSKKEDVLAVERRATSRETALKVEEEEEDQDHPHTEITEEETTEEEEAEAILQPAAEVQSMTREER